MEEKGSVFNIIKSNRIQQFNHSSFQRDSKAKNLKEFIKKVTKI